MAVALKDVNFYKTTSGLGGAITATRLLSQTATLSASIAGVSSVDAADNSTGSGTLRYVGATKAFYYTPPGGSEGSAVIPIGDGEIIVRGAGSRVGYVRLDITFASLPGTNASVTVTIANDANELFDDVTKQQAIDGHIEYRCIYFQNDHATDDVLGVALWIHADSVGGDAIAIGLDPAGVGGTATTIAADTDAPSGVTFSQPASEGAALLVSSTIAAGDSFAFWIRRTVPVSTLTAVPDDYSWLRFRILT